MEFESVVDVSTGHTNVGGAEYRCFDSVEVTEKVMEGFRKMIGSSVYNAYISHNGSRYETGISCQVGFWRGMFQTRQQKYILDFRDMENLRESYRLIEDWKGWMKTAGDEVVLHEIVNYLKGYVLE